MTRTFKLYRDEDPSDVSGTGLICEGVLFSDGQAAIHWLGKWPLTTPHPDGLSSVMGIHGHNGKTRLVWDDDVEGKWNFTEEDIILLHQILQSLPESVSFLAASTLLGKIRMAMRQQIPPDNPVKG